MERPAHISIAEWKGMNAEEVEEAVNYIEIKLPFRLQQLARTKYGLKFNPEKKTNFYDAKYALFYEKKYLMNFTKYSSKLSEKFTWDSENRCYYYYAFEADN